MHCHENVEIERKRFRDKHYDLVLKFRNDIFLFVLFEDGKGKRIKWPSFMPEKYNDDNIDKTYAEKKITMDELVDIIKRNGYTNTDHDWAVYDDLWIEGFWKNK
jgi:hypothetical protein